MLVLRAAAVLFCSDCLITSLKLKLEQKSQHFVQNFPHRTITAVTLVTADHAPSWDMIELAPLLYCCLFLHLFYIIRWVPAAAPVLVQHCEPDTEITSISIMTGAATGCGVWIQQTGETVVGG